MRKAVFESFLCTECFLKQETSFVSISLFIDKLKNKNYYNLTNIDEAKECDPDLILEQLNYDGYHW